MIVAYLLIDESSVEAHPWSGDVIVESPIHQYVQYGVHPQGRKPNSCSRVRYRGHIYIVIVDVEVVPPRITHLRPKICKNFFTGN